MAWIHLSVAIVLGTIGQLALKAGLQRPEGGRRSGALVVWLLCYAVATLLWLLALRALPLSQAFPVLGLQFALVPLASRAILREQVTGTQWSGILLIVLGVALVGGN